ncbi:MAG: aldehyde dehydrogenase family protein [Candidatus Cloacimonetes bacterium]|nr:aldehyde dehydrogenase family protein [Candidatus Cloacimonadota bacterium]
MSTEQEKANVLLEKSIIAAGVFNQFNQNDVDRIVKAVYEAAFNNRVSLAKMAVEETELGVWQHKVMKNVLASQFVYENIKDEKTVGILSHDNISGITEIAQPLGPVFAVIPVTNPTSTVIYKILLCLKTRNPIIISSHRRAKQCSIKAAQICYEAALKAGAPEDCILWIEESSRELTHAFMTDKRMALILATGGTGLVKAAYSSGTPAIGVGPGNVPVFIDESADVPLAVKSVISSKSFDNGTVCASEQSVIVEKKIADEVIDEFKKQNCYFLSPDEIKKIEAFAINEKTDGMSADVVGQSAEIIAKKAGIMIPNNIIILMAKLDGVGEEYPLSSEVLAPILAFYVADNYDDALKTCIDLNYLGGIGHTASIYANDKERIAEFSNLMNAGRVVVNTPSAQGAVGGLFNTLPTAFTLGCGAGGKNITTENITAINLINVKRICRRREDRRWFAFDSEKFLDENLKVNDIITEYNKNY